MSITTTPYGFIPTQVSGLVLWLDASDPTTITQSSGNITQWRDKSTSALTATGVSNPQYVTNVQNGFPGISFDGSTQYFNLGNNLSMGTNQLYIFVVSKFNSTADGAIIGKSLYGGATGRYSLLRVGGTLNPLIQGSGGGNDTGVNSDTSTSTRLLNMVWDRSNIILYQNGSSIFSLSFSDSANVTNGFSLLIGAYQNSSGGTPPVAGLYMNGYIHEILMYMTPTGSPLGNTARQQIESYLAQKWGLTLGAGHPGLTSTVYRSTYLKNSAVKRNIATMTPFFAAFSPRQIPGLILWVDGADPAGNGVIPANDATVSTWVDKSGLVNNATTYSGITTYSTSLKALFFSNSGFQTSIVTPTNRVGSGFFVVRATVNSGNVVFQGSGLGYGGRQFRNDNGTILKTIKENIVEMFLAGPTVLNRLMLVGYVDDGNNLTHCLNGTLYTTTTATTFTEGRTILLGKSFNGEHLIGYIHEVVLFNINVTVTQRQQIESYLAQKWGLTSSLAAGHLHLTQPAGARTALSLANSKMSIISRRITAFTSFRWTITAGNTDPFIQMSEFQVGFNNTQVVFVSPSISTSGTQYEWYYTTPASHAVDNNIISKAFALGVPALFTVTVASPITVNMYRWATANDSTPGRNPTQWTVDGSADGVTFVRLHTQNTTYAGPNTTFTYTSWINFTY